MSRVIAHPAPATPRRPLATVRLRISGRGLHGIIGVCLLAVLVPGIRHLRAAGPASAVATAPRSWIAHGTLVTVYGRALGTAPILGSLGSDTSLHDVARQITPAEQAVKANTGDRPVRLAIHLIYGLAASCASAPRCLLYLDDQGQDLVRQYIEPAARRGWLVILDDQLGRSNPVAEMQRIISRGYLAYDNVEVAFDPEFRTSGTAATPGVPVGHVTAGELNRAAWLMDAYSRRRRLAHQKLLLVHQWIPSMIRHRRHLHADLPYVQPVIVMDGTGEPAAKARVYHALLRGAPADHVMAGIKLFPPNGYDPTAPVDAPLLTWQEIFGNAPIAGAVGGPIYLRPLPRVIVMT